MKRKRPKKRKVRDPWRPTRERYGPKTGEPINVMHPAPGTPQQVIEAWWGPAFRARRTQSRPA